MRTPAAGELATLALPHVNVYVKVEVMDADNVWRDLSAVAGGDWLVGARYGDNGDQPGITGTIEILREDTAAHTSMSPFMTGSSINRNMALAFAPFLDTGRLMRLSTAVVAAGNPVTVWREGFQGVFGKIHMGGKDEPRITASFRDLMGFLIDQQIETVRRYDNPVGQPVQTIMQSILNDNGDAAITLVTPVNPGWQLVQYGQNKAGMYEALHTLAQQIGYDVRYKYDALDVYGLTFYAPDRTKTVSDATFAPTQYEDVESLDYDEADVRNVISGTFIDRATGAKTTLTVTDATSVARYKRRFLGITEEASSNIDSATEMTALLNAALSDCATVPVAETIRLIFWPLVEIGDLYTLAANGVHYDTDQQRAAFGYQHEISGGHGQTTIQTRGKPASQYIKWLQMAGQASSFADLQIVVSPGPSAYTITWSGDNVLLSIDGGTPVSPPASPIVVVRDVVSHLYQFTAPSGHMFPVVIPAAFAAGPEISYTADEVTGAITVYVDGAPESDRTFVAVRTDHRPAVTEILPPAEGGISTVYGEVGPGVRTGRVTSISIVDVVNGTPVTLTGLPPGKKFFIGAVSKTEDGTTSGPSYINDVFLGVNATPAASFAFGPAVVSDQEVVFNNLVIGSATQRVEFFVAESATDPSPGSANPPSVEALAPQVEDWIERRPDGTIETAIRFPLVAPGDYLTITAVVIDHLHRRGATVTVKVQASGAAATPPGTPTLSGPPVSINSTISVWQITFPGSGGPYDAVRAWIDGYQTPDVLVSSLTSGNTFLINGTPGQTIRVSIKLVDSATGAVSNMSNVVTATFTGDTSAGGSGTGTNGKLATPTGNPPSTWDATSQIMLVPFLNGAMPSGTVFSLLRATAFGGPYTQVGTGCIASPYEWDGETPNTAADQHVYYEIVATCPGFTDSDPSSVIPGIVLRGRA